MIIMKVENVGHQPEPVPTPIAGVSRQPDASGKRYRSLFISISVVLFLVIPALVVAMHPLSSSMQGPVAPQVASPSLAALQQRVQGNPSVESRVDLAAAYINQGQASRALPLLLSSIAEQSNNAAAWNDLCVAYTLEKSYALAVPACRKAIILAPDFELARNNLRWAEHEQRVAEESVKATENTPDLARDVPFYLNRGTEQLHLGRYGEAISSWKHALQLDPRNAIAANDIGVAYMLMKQTDKASVWFNQALALDPQFQLAKNNLAWAHAEQALPSSK